MRVRRLIKIASNRRFARHYAEMALVMLVGMGLLALPAHWLTGVALPAVDVDDPTVMLARMALIMTLPMVPWMLWRGHGWAPTREMAAAMLVPAVGVIALEDLGMVESLGALMTIEHVVMFAAMFVAMASRPEEYSRCRGNGSPVPTGEVDSGGLRSSHG